MSRLLKQWRRPTGWLGRSIVWAMNISHSKLTDWGLKHISIERHWTILDVGCGGGRTIHKLGGIATEGKVYGVDFSDESVSVSRRTNEQMIKMGRVEIRYGSVSCLPFSGNMFDLVTAVNTHYYWPDLGADLGEVLRVLKPGGKLIVIGEGYKGGKYDDRNRKWAELFGITYRSVGELDDLFSSAGYSNVQMYEEYDRGWICGIGEKPFHMSRMDTSSSDTRSTPKYGNTFPFAGESPQTDLYSKPPSTANLDVTVVQRKQILGRSWIDRKCCWHWVCLCD